MDEYRFIFNLLSYRPVSTGLSQYASRILHYWPGSIPFQLRLTQDGSYQLDRTLDPAPAIVNRFHRFRQSCSLAQYGISLPLFLSSISTDLIYCPFPEFLWAARRTPQVLTCHDLTPLFYPNSRRAFWYTHLLTRQYLHRSHAVVAISRFVADQLLSNGFSSKTIHIIPNGVPISKTLITQPLTNNILVIARHSRNKNLSLAISGFHKFLALSPNWNGKLIIVGQPGSLTPLLHRQLYELGLDQHVVLIEYLSDSELNTLLHHSFCLVSASLMEGFDYPLLEAQAVGLPTLASRIPVHEEFHAQSSLLFETDDGGLSMAHMLHRLANESSLWDQMSRAGRRNALGLTMCRQTHSIAQLLDELAP